MRLALNGWFYAHHAHTGTGSYVRALVRALPQVAPQHDYWLITPQPVVAPPGWQVKVARTGAGDWDKLRFEQALFPQACRAVRAEVAHVPHWAPPLSSAVPFAVTVHDLIPLILPAYRGGLLARAYTALATAATPGAAALLADSQATRAAIVQHLTVPEAKVHTVPLGVDERFTPRVADPAADEQARARYGLPEAYVLYVGGFDIRKNVRALLAAWTWAAGSVGHDYPLVLAGALPQPDGRLFEDLPAYAAQLGIQDTVRFVGAVEAQDLPALYRGAGAFAYPSENEGFGLPPLEAMACGVPVLAPGAGAVGEVVGEAAFLIDPADTRKFGAGLITCLIEPTVYDHLKARGLARAKQFTWTATAQKTLAVLETLHA